jgi:hypothetical protein
MYRYIGRKISLVLFPTPIMYLLNFSESNHFATREEKHVNLITWAPCYSPQLMQKKWIDFLETTKFHSNENIEWHCMHLEVNWNSIDFNWIQIHWLELVLNSNSTKFNSKIILKWNWIEFKFIWKKWDAKWWKKYW